MLYNNGIKSKDIWEEASHFFVKTKSKTALMNLKKFYTEDKFGLFIDLRSMSDHSLHGEAIKICRIQ